MAVAFHTRNAVTGITVLDVDADTTAGTGTLAVASADTVTWTAPGSETAGSAVTIANGEKKLVYDGETTTLYILVERTSATDLDTDEAAVVVVTTGVTTAERLAQVDDAITACLVAQRSGLGTDAAIEIARLNDLRDYRNELARTLARENGQQGRVGTPDFRNLFQ